MRVTLLDGSFHEVDSSELAFRTCASMAFRRGFLQGAPELLEPIMRLNVTTPEEFSGSVTGNMCFKRGHILGMERQGNAQIIKALCPLVNLFGYAGDVRTMTQGRASFSMHFERYEVVPPSLAQAVLLARCRQPA
jgi:elongation factor G